MIIPDIIETTPSHITKKQGGALWLINIEAGLLSVYKNSDDRLTPVTVFVRSAGQIETCVMWAHPESGLSGYEF